MKDILRCGSYQLLPSDKAYPFHSHSFVTINYILKWSSSTKTTQMAVVTVLFLAAMYYNETVR